MNQNRIAELLAPFIGSTTFVDAAGKAGGEVPAGLYENISTYVDILLRWNARINLTAIRDPEQIVIRHFGESLFTARHLFGHERLSAETPAGGKPHTLADIGSGAGFPGLPIKLWNPAIRPTLIEANHKKATFLREVVRSLGLTNVQIENVRSENSDAQQFDVVTLRAVEKLGEALPSAIRLAGESGRLALLIGDSQIAAIRLQSPDVLWKAPVAIPLSHSRVLLVGRKNQAG